MVTICDVWVWLTLLCGTRSGTSCKLYRWHHTCHTSGALHAESAHGTINDSDPAKDVAWADWHAAAVHHR